MQVAIGKIVNTQGIKGEVRILSNSDFKDIRFALGGKLYIKTRTDMITVTIEKHYQNKTFDIVKLVGYDNINDVTQFKNCLIYGDELTNDQLDDNEYLTSSLIAMNVIDQDNNQCGTVIEVIENPAHNILRVKKNDSNFLVPFNEHFILDVNTDSKTIKIELIDGLIDEN